MRARACSGCPRTAPSSTASASTTRASRGRGRASRGGRPGSSASTSAPTRTLADRIADYVLGVKTFAPLADYFTINVSSPNTPGLRDLQRREALDDLVARVVEARDETAPRRPVLVKIAPDLDDHGPRRHRCGRASRAASTA